MKRFIIVFGIAFIGLVATSLEPSFAQKKGVKNDTREMIKGIEKKLSFTGDAKEIEETLERVGDLVTQLQGSTISARVGMLLSHGSPAVRRQAATTIVRLMASSQHNLNFVHGLLKLLDDQDNECRLIAVSGSWRFGEHAKAAVPKLVKMTKDDDVRIRRAAVTAVGMFARNDKELIPVMIAALDDPDEGETRFEKGRQMNINCVAYVAMATLCQCGPSAKAAVPKMIEVFKEGKRVDPKRTLHKLSILAPTDPFLMATVKEWLKHKDPDYRGSAAGVMYTMGEHAKEALPELIFALQAKDVPDRSTEYGIKRTVISILEKIGPAAKDALPALEALSGIEDRSLGDDIQRAIETIRGK